MSQAVVSHQPMDQFTVKDNDLLIGGYSVSQISRLVGKQAFYAYDRQVIAGQIAKFRQFMPQRIHLHYAVKANPNPAVVHFMQPLVDGFDVASQKEMLIALQSGMPAKDISFAGPGKSDVELAAAIEAGVTLHVESVNELQRVELLGKAAGKTPQVALRINPAFELKSSGMKMAGGAKPFGIDEEQVFALFENFQFAVRLRGFHIFAGSQNLKAEALIEAHSQTFALAARLVASCPQPVDVVNLGGGLGIPYFPGEQRLDLVPVGENLTQLTAQYAEQFNNIELVMELGRFLVAEAGVYCCQILDKKVSRGTTYLVSNGGLHHHLANSGNFGQVIRKNYPVAIANKMAATETELVTIVGPLCTPLDILADRMQLPVADVGDWVAVFQSGAYGPTASPQDFLGHPHVVEILL